MQEATILQSRSHDYSDCSRRGSHLVEPLCYGVILMYVVPSLYNVVFCTHVAVCKEESSSPVSAFTERRDMISF